MQPTHNRNIRRKKRGTGKKISNNKNFAELMTQDNRHKLKEYLVYVNTKTRRQISRNQRPTAHTKYIMFKPPKSKDRENLKRKTEKKGAHLPSEEQG